MMMENKLGMKLEHRLAQIMNLEQRLRLKIGKFEKQILKKIELINIDLDESPYHIDMLGALVVRESEKNSLIGNIVERSGLTKKAIQKIIVESFSMEDISLDIGTKRDVDVITIVFEDDKELALTVSLDKEHVDEIEKSASYQEAQVLQRPEAQDTWAVQKYYGSTQIKEADGFRGVICKEFLNGPMLANTTSELDPHMSGAEQSKAKRRAYAAGKMIANTLEYLGGIPRDSNPLNIIVMKADEDEEHTRYCDVEEIISDPDGIKDEVQRLKKDFGEYGDELVKGITEHYSGPLLQKI